MRHPSLPLPCVLVVVSLACGSGSTPAPPPPATPPALAPESAASAVSAVFLPEVLTGLESLPRLQATEMPGVYGLAGAPALGCVQVSLTGPTTQTWTFQCTTPDGGSVTGSVAITFTAQSAAVTYTQLTWAKGGQRWTLNGTRNLLRPLGSRTATLTYTGFSVAYADSATTVTQTTTISGSGTLDASQAGQLKLHGTWTLTEGSRTRTLDVPQAQALTWSPGCCWPTSGVATVTEGGLGATATFTVPCGTLSVASGGLPPVSRSLPGCPG